MTQSAVEAAINELTQAGMVTPGDLKGCTLEEIGQIKTRFRLQLPAIYKEFLTRMGKGAGRFLNGSDYLFPALLRLREDAESILKESEMQFKLDAKDFVFVGHQGYEFLYFNSRQAPDPPVFLLTEGDEPQQVFAHFSEWLLSCVSDEIEAFKSVREPAARKTL